MAAARAAGGAALDPKDAHFERLDAAITAHGCKGSFLIVGVDSGDSDQEEEEQDGGAEPVRANNTRAFPPRCGGAGAAESRRAPLRAQVYTVEQMAKLRHVLCNDAREAAVKEAMAAVLDEDSDDGGFGMFNTASGETLPTRRAPGCAAALALMRERPRGQATRPLKPPRSGSSPRTASARCPRASTRCLL